MSNQEFKVGDRVKTNCDKIGTIANIDEYRGSTFYGVKYDVVDLYGYIYGRFLSDELDLLDHSPSIYDILEIANRNLNMLKYSQPATKQFSEQEVIDYIYDVITKRI